MKNILFLFVFACFSLFFARRSDAQCYVRLEDASGFNTDAYQDTLQAAAAKLCAIFDSTGFAGQFKVYDFGFYLHQENTTGGYPEPFAQKMTEVQDSSPYYLLFGKQTDKSGVYTQFWVDLVLPDTGKFACLDLLFDGFRANLTEKTKIITNTIHLNSISQTGEYHIAEIGSIDSLINVLNRIFSCCDPVNRPVSCSSCLYTPAQIFNLFNSNGFAKVPVLILQNKFIHSDSSKIDKLIQKRDLVNFIDISNLNIFLNGSQVDVDGYIDSLLKSIASKISSKGVYSDNNSFCNYNVMQYFVETRSNSFGFYIWAHAWEDPLLVQNYLFYKIMFSDNGNNKDLDFFGHAPMESELISKINNDYVKNTIKSIYKKNGYIINVDFEHKNLLEWNDLYNYIQHNPIGESPSIGYSLVDNQTGISTNEPGSAFIQFQRWTEYKPKLTNDHSNYVLGYALSHEFLHQILEKSYHFIFKNTNGMLMSANYHLILEKNLLFEGDGLKSRRDYLFPQDKDTGSYSSTLYFTGRYLPKSNNTVTSAWERISPSHKKLINSYWALNQLQQDIGSTSPVFIFWRDIFSKELKNYDYSIP